jgi:hypothetical protein
MTKLHTVRALEQILSLREVGTRICDYGADFNEMWNLESLHGFKHAIVVWTDTPVDPDVHPVRTEHYLTPFDWAIAACSKDQTLRITVIDLRGKEHDQADYAALRWYRTQRPECVPWLRRLVVKDLVDVTDLDGLVDKLTKSVTTGEPIVARGEALQMLPICRVDLSEHADHHAIANLVGPLLLLNRVSPPFTTAQAKEPPPANHRQALRQILATAGFVPEPKDPPEDEAPPFAQLGKVRVFLLDDQWHHGWGEWVCKMVGVDFVPAATLSDEPQKISTNGAVEVFAAHDPKWLLRRLGSTDQRFQLSLDGPQNGQDILLLDLRLFTGREAGEREFFDNVLRGYCKRFESGEHAWRGIHSNEWNLAAGTSVARSLLPRLVALTDFSLPIVLFSSTADRQFIEHFKDYGNIITTFAKPRLLGTGYVQEETTSAFRAALREACSLSQARVFLQRVLKTAERGKNVAKGFLKSENGEAPTGAPWKYAELYLDESGKEDRDWFKAGGYIAIHKSEALGNKVEFKKKWGFSRDEPFSDRRPTHSWLKASDLERDTLLASHRTQEQKDAARKRKASELRERASSVETAVRDAGGLLAACLMRRGQADKMALDGPDATYRAMAGAIIEFFLFDWLPALEIAADMKSGTLRAGVFLGTRQWVVDADKVIKNQWDYGLAINTFTGSRAQKNAAVVQGKKERDLEGSIGYDSRSGDALSAISGIRATCEIAGNSMGFGDAYPLVVAISQQRSATGVEHRVRRAVAVQLDNFSRERTNLYPPELPRQIHYASDDFLGGSSENIVTGPLEVGFETEHSHAFASLLRASRALDSLATLPRGLQDLREAMTMAKSRELDSPLRWVAVRCEPLLNKMSGMAFIQFARGVVVLRDARVRTRSDSPPKKRRNRKRRQRGKPARPQSSSVGPPGPGGASAASVSPVEIPSGDATVVNADAQPVILTTGTTEKIPSDSPDGDVAMISKREEQAPEPPASGEVPNDMNPGFELHLQPDSDWQARWENLGSRWWRCVRCQYSTRAPRGAHTISCPRCESILEISGGNSSH